MKNNKEIISLIESDNINELSKYIEENNININFAYRTFKWNNEAKGKAAVHCVIIGFSKNLVKSNKKI